MFKRLQLLSTEDATELSNVGKYLQRAEKRRNSIDLTLNIITVIYKNKNEKNLRSTTREKCVLKWYSGVWFELILL